MFNFGYSVNEEELDFHDENHADYQGSAFTGYSVHHERGLITVSCFLLGEHCGVEFSVWSGAGSLRYYTNATFHGLEVGGLYAWNNAGALRSETVKGFTWTTRVQRRWDDSGRLLSDERGKGAGHEREEQRLGLGFVPWMVKPVAGGPGEPRNWAFDGDVAEDEVRWDALDERLRVRGEAYWGYLTSITDNGRTRMRQVLDGRDEGPVWEWSPSGKLVLQGVLHHPYGRVGPWHEWDETGRLVSETIYDALGNRIIDRRLDEVGNIAHEERYEPVRLWRDPETGNERPAPWLWF